VHRDGDERSASRVSTFAAADRSPRCAHDHLHPPRPLRDSARWASVQAPRVGGGENRLRAGPNSAESRPGWRRRRVAAARADLPQYSERRPAQPRPIPLAHALATKDDSDRLSWDDHDSRAVIRCCDGDMAGVTGGDPGVAEMPGWRRCEPARTRCARERDRDCGAWLRRMRSARSMLAAARRTIDPAGRDTYDDRPDHDGPSDRPHYVVLPCSHVHLDALLTHQVPRTGDKAPGPVHRE
jgi:hypothetical protein